MELTSFHIFMTFAAAAATVLVIFFTASSLDHGRRRLMLIMNTLGIAVLGVSVLAGLALLVWGLAAGRKDLVYFSFLPFVFAGIIYDYITRRHATLWGILGFNDSSERWNSFWRETVDAWKSLAGATGARSPTATASPPRRTASPAKPSAAPSASRTFSFSFKTHGPGANLLAPLLLKAAQRLSDDHISVFPNCLDLMIDLDGMNHTLSSLRDFRHHLVVRRHDGQPLQLAVSTDLPFLRVTGTAPQPDGSHLVEIEIITTDLVPGPFTGSILIDTDDAAQPQLTVPVSGTVTLTGA